MAFVLKLTSLTNCLRLESLGGGGKGGREDCCGHGKVRRCCKMRVQVCILIVVNLALVLGSALLNAVRIRKYVQKLAHWVTIMLTNYSWFAPILSAGEATILFKDYYYHRRSQRWTSALQIRSRHRRSQRWTSALQIRSCHRRKYKQPTGTMLRPRSSPVMLGLTTLPISVW